MAKDKEAHQFSLLIVSPDEVLYEGFVTKVTAPGLYQQLAILPDHTPLYAQLIKGAISITPLEGNVSTLNIDSGIIRVRANKTSIITGFDVRGDILGSKKL